MEKQPLENPAVRKTVLYEAHLKLTPKNRMAPFAGYMMPLWYSSISNEHHAVRLAAGLFDVSHMGIIEVKGPEAAAFLNAATTNDVNLLKPGQAQYSYILTPSGLVMDDLIIYRLLEDYFMVVANASNEAAVRSWFADLLSGSSIVDNNRPDYRIPYKPQIRDLREVPGPYAKVDLALQGPKSIDVLLSLKLHHTHAEQLKNLKSFQICAINLSGLDVTIARTGYTGAKTGYEIFVHPSQALEFWDLLLENGKPIGLEPCGLGARDSLRIEAGLPLYGHELDGESNLSPYEAGYPWAVKLDKEFFIGRNYMLERSQTYNTQVFRLGFPGSKGIRPIRTNDAVLDPAGKCIGFVTSSATINEQQVSLALLNKDSVTEAQPVGIYYLARSQAHIDAGKKSIVAKNEILNSDLTGKVLPRFCRF